MGFLIAFKEAVPARGRLYIDAIGAAAGYRRSGVATALYREMFDAAKAAGLVEIRTRITPDNDRSLALHESMGFTLRECVEATLEL